MSTKYILYNPLAGNGKGEEEAKKLTETYKNDELKYCNMTHITSYGAFFDSISPKSDIIICGGDGTLNECVNGAVGHDNVAVTHFPCGTGNDLVRALGIPKDTDRALEILLKGHVRKMDAAMANDEIYFNVAGFGFDVDVLDATEKYKDKYKNGSIAYLRGLMDCILHLDLRKTKITWPEGSMEKDVLILVAGNGTHIGGGMNITPGADPFDGLLNVCVIHDVKRRHIPTLLPKFLSGKHIGNPRVTYFRTTELTAECSPHSRIEVDGEVMEGTPVTFRVLPGKLNVIVPEQN